MLVAAQERVGKVRGNEEWSWFYCRDRYLLKLCLVQNTSNDVCVLTLDALDLEGDGLHRRHFTVK